MVKEFGALHDEVSSSFSKQAEQHTKLQHKVASTADAVERLLKGNADKEERIRSMEADLAREGDHVERLRAEHAALEEKNKWLGLRRWPHAAAAAS